MTKLNIKTDCSNSPKKEFIKAFNCAFARGDATFLIDHVCHGIVWKIHGDKTIEGKEAFSEEVHKMKTHIADELTLHSIITHGKEGSANGDIKMGSKTYAFCDVYSFTDTTGKMIKTMDSYVIKV